jgi:chromosomal replication initiation ATPase DnaA
MGITKGHFSAKSKNNIVISKKNRENDEKVFELQMDDLHLNTAYSFQHFAVGQSNRLAIAACRSVVEMPGLLYNPLFIHSSVGLGKHIYCKVLFMHQNN